MKKRPEVLEGKTIKAKCGCGSMYVTLNKDPETKEFIEVKLNLGKRGSCINSLLYREAILFSIILQLGATKDEVLKLLKRHWLGVSCENAEKEVDGRISSCGDVIGRLIIQELEK